MNKNFFFFMIAIALISGCQSASSNEEESRCVPASDIQLRNIKEGYKSANGPYSINSAWAVKSDDFENVWMVAAYIYGTGMEEGIGPAVWAMNGNPDEQGITLSVDDYAKEFSVWPDASKTDAAINTGMDGVQEAINCAEMNK